MTLRGIRLNTVKTRILKTLGDEWTVKIIDFELCVYRDLGDYDIEISGGSYGRPVHIFVWEKHPLGTVEQHMDLNPRTTDFKALCDDIVARYS